MIVATAGHIDHGKTLLVRTLTGVDTDRLPEEKRRGISIDLGFAYLRTPADGLLGFVDVPGHERFVRNMLAGVCAIDAAMIVVAADDGIMPQTVEHLQILDLLGVSRGYAVITKIDRVSAARVAEVGAALSSLLAGGSLAGIDIFPVCAPTGEGIVALKESLLADAGHIAARRSSGRARYAIDRVFSVAGSGTVVTGSVFDGRITVGAQLMASPVGLPLRVRGIQMNGVAVEAVPAGERCALNLAGAGLDRDALGRGDWLLHEALHRPTTRLDVRLRLLASEAGPLRHLSPLHLHLGTAAVPGRIAVRRGGSIAPGESAIVQLVLERPLCALHGDRFVLRDASASRTLGGGTVIDPVVPAFARHTPARLAQLDALEAVTAQAALGRLVELMPQGVDLAQFEASFNLDEVAASEIYRALGLVVIGRPDRLGLAAAEHARLREAALAEVERVHVADPKSPGIEPGALRARLGTRLPASAFARILAELAAENRLQIVGAHVRRPGHDATDNPEDAALWAHVLPLLDQAVPLPPKLKDLADALKLPERKLSDLLHRRSKSGEPVKVMADRFLLRRTVLALAAHAAATAAASPNGQFTAAQYRDRSGVSRNHAIELLEYFDRIGYTQRLGDARKIRRPIEQALK
jgi:selenocysteine-specific elongation factor